MKVVVQFVIPAEVVVDLDTGNVIEATLSMYESHADSRAPVEEFMTCKEVGSELAEKAIKIAEMADFYWEWD